VQVVVARNPARGVARIDPDHHASHTVISTKIKPGCRAASRA
jgi:hypothetical protein